MSRNFSEESARKIDAFVKDTIDTQFERAMGMLKTHEKKLRELAEVLLKKETMSVDEFRVVFDGGKPVKKKPAVTEEEDAPEAEAPAA